jgi:hypothetical protein
MVLKPPFLFGNTRAQDLCEKKKVLSVHQEIQSEGSSVLTLSGIILPSKRASNFWL